MFNYGFYPAKKYGGPVNSIQNLCDLLREDAECYILTCDHDLGDRERLDGIEYGWNQRRNCQVMYLSDKQICYSNIISIIKEVSPDVIYLNSIFEACFVIPVLVYGRHNPMQKIVIAPRGDLCPGAMRKKYKKIPYLQVIKGFRLAKHVLFHSTSNEEDSMIYKYLGKKSKICQIENIPSYQMEENIYRRKQNKELRVMFVGRIAIKKNVLQAIKIVKAAGHGIYLDIYGPIEDETYWKNCLELIGENETRNIKYMGLLEHEKVYEEFRNHDLFLFPTYSENYGHVIVESLQCGCPVLISDQTPWNDVEEKGAGWSFPLEAQNKFVETVQAIRDLDSDEYDIMRQKAVQYINSHVDFKELRKDYLKLFGGEL